MKLLFAALLSFPLLAFAANDQSGAIRLAMGPDPGGHSGATVTPETTKTDSPAVDAARKSTSGSKTETNDSAGASTQSKKK